VGRLFLLLLVSALAAVVGVASCNSLSQGGRGKYRGWTVRELLGVIERERERGDTLVARSEAMSRCLKGKLAAVSALAEGRSDLLSTAATFRRLQQEVPNYPWPWFRSHHGAATEEECLCLAVIEYLQEIPDIDAAERADLVSRLQGELKHHKDRGTLSLPRGLPSQPVPSPQ
jgi:hypothetical protein